MTASINPDDNLLAAEYVLRLLEGDELRDTQVRARDDNEFSLLVSEWREKFGRMNDGDDDVHPHPATKAAVMHTLFGAERKVSLWNEMPFWRFATAALVVLSVGLGALLILDRSVDLSPQFQAELSSADGSLVLIAGVIPLTHEIVIDRISGASPEGRVLELWLIAQGVDSPVSLGLLAQEGRTRIRVPDDIAPGVRTGTIAISDEPPGGAPAGVPTGAILATAVFEDI